MSFEALKANGYAKIAKCRAKQMLLCKQSYGMLQNATECDRPKNADLKGSQHKALKALENSSGLGISVAFPNLTAVFQQVQKQEGQEGQGKEKKWKTKMNKY